MQLHGVQWGCLISETLCIDCDLISQLMKNQLLAMSRIKPNICLLWFHNRFQYCLWKIEVMIFPGETQAGRAAGRASALASVHRQGLSSAAPLSGFPAGIEWPFLRYSDKGEVRRNKCKESWAEGPDESVIQIQVRKRGSLSGQSQLPTLCIWWNPRAQALLIKWIFRKWIYHVRA